MGFSGGGANVTKSHTHSSSIVQDGGSLNFDNVTQAGLAAGDITYSNGTALQVLGLGSATDTLTVNAGATAPEWASAAGGGAAVEFVAFERAASTTTTVDISFSSISRADISELLCFTSGAAGGNMVGLQINGNTTGYQTQGFRQAGGVQTIINSAAQTGYELVTQVYNSHFGVFHIMASNNNGDVDGDICITSQVSGASGYETSGGICTTNTGDFTQVKIGISVSNSMEAGSWLSIYKVLNS